MKFQLNPASEPHFTAYGAGYVAVNGERFEHHVLLEAGRGAVRWEVANFESLAATDFAALAALGAEIVILGVGDRLRFPHPSLTRPLLEARIGLEVMDTGAACRTYNVLVAEGRKVLAAILLA